ncbi:MocR-like pyridoxine biosynthesis transcription factor PdxR [Saccharothrix variisporea]|uniref:GntR family transcriptional regulator/MocR family aminotransferase n=1 Tax=Saccharothrix variisporea TaxID=543527 RepID=A0A495XMG5_9PSEU|nr:PLP-dependent aminotransferase family protein [Saccharothrix variisporea]RKT72808.1 GntR family transcriptional regulator/MocR family aminotransferase [Saccharothrix variisporea]
MSPGSDFLLLDPADAPARGLADWLAGRLRVAIAEGRLPVGGRLPATRTLAADLGVSRGVVTEAYRRLAEDGHVTGRGRAGTVVTAVPARPVAPAVPSAPPVFPTVPGADVFDVVREAPARIDLSPGVPDLTAFPRAAWLRAERSVLARLSSAEFGYGDPRGTPALRAAVTRWLARTRGIVADPDEVVIVTGVAQALALLAETLLDAGTDELAVEDPGSLGVRQHLNHHGLATPPVPVDDQGLVVSELHTRAVLVTPAHQFPTGVVLTPDRRRELDRWGGLVVEDDYDAEHRYDRPPVPALKAALPDRVCYAGSVSKLLAPALRTGWLLVPARHREAVVAAKRFADLGSTALPQLVLAELMDSGELEKHLRLLRRRHVRRRDAMTRAIADHLPGARVHGVAAGLYLTVTFPDDVPDTDLAAAALDLGVKAQPLSWHAQRPTRPGLVLGYAANPGSVLTEGIATIAQALHQLR